MISSGVAYPIAYISILLLFITIYYILFITIYYYIYIYDGFPSYTSFRIKGSTAPAPPTAHPRSMLAAGNLGDKVGIMLIQNLLMFMFQSCYMNI